MGDLDMATMVDEFGRLSGLLSDGLEAMRRQATELADAENVYRKAKAEAWLRAPAGTVPEREAFVNAATADQRKRRDLAEYMRTAAIEAVRSRRTQISALQTMLNAYQEEARFERTAPGRAA